MDANINWHHYITIAQIQQNEHGKHSKSLFFHRARNVLNNYTKMKRYEERFRLPDRDNLLQELDHIRSLNDDDNNASENSNQFDALLTKKYDINNNVVRDDFKITFSTSWSTTCTSTGTYHTTCEENNCND